jgi:hypothetical protein
MDCRQTRSNPDVVVHFRNTTTACHHWKRYRRIEATNPKNHRIANALGLRTKFGASLYCGLVLFGATKSDATDGEKTALVCLLKTCHLFRIYFWAFPFWELDPVWWIFSERGSRSVSRLGSGGCDRD